MYQCALEQANIGQHSFRAQRRIEAVCQFCEHPLSSVSGAAHMEAVNAHLEFAHAGQV